MEVEKQKILGTAQKDLKTESSQTIGQQPKVEIKEPVENKLIGTDDTFFKKHKGYILGGIALLLVAIGLVFVPKIISHFNSVPVPNESVVETSTPLALKGVIDDKIGFTMHLIKEGNEIKGTEHYDSQRKEVNVVIKGVSDNGKMVLYEYDGNTKAGSFEGTIGEYTYSGTFTNSKGKTYKFTARVLTESVLAKIEEEEKQFETTKIVYTNKTSSANVELSVDYPIKGNDALLQNTRNFIKEVIANMFQIDEYKGSLNYGNSVINSYGKAKFDELDREWKEGATEGSPGYIETIEFKKDYENDYCVSLCAHSYYFHGGVSNEFCNASTFRKVDGKKVSIIRSANNTGLDRLIISALKNKLGEDYENVNDDFKSSPWAGFEHLVNGGVQIDYQHYEIGPGYFGQVSITIPYEKIKPYMTEEAKNILKE
jgi:hypothetical protein